MALRLVPCAAEGDFAIITDSERDSINMKDYTYKTSGVCARQIDFSIEDGKLHNVRFTGGCPGNTAAIGKLLEGADAKATMDLLRGNQCGARGTSCADQLSRGIEQALAGL